SHRTALWEANRALAALRPLGIPVVLLKGAAYVAAGLPAAEGRTVGDLDILVPRARIDEADAALRAAGWAPLKSDPYDDAYYRQWMHELPPLAHADRGTVIDVHHTILPLTARLRPDAAALLADAIELSPGLFTLSPADMIVHSALHAFHDGDLDGGLRNLWDIHALARDFAERDCFWSDLAARARLHGATGPVSRALRLSARLFGTVVDAGLAGPARATDAQFARRLLATDGWGRPIRPALRFGFYARSHWLRMPPLMLARHLWTKWRMRRAG
ncbi:MAG: nucleotidyltransferase family protein, partial [Alphaproteobacteria bacterium]|nr:nucleotidyltransferase family protein [Alphaproteobacteria bacterium]